MARLLLKPSELILADEPTGNLDSKNSELITDLFFKLRDLGKTIIIATHDMQLANKCDEIIYIDKLERN
jgi:ABC-type antimicrobial peptide transport system, ATPase component